MNTKKTCPCCTELIGTTAKVCPRCRQWQTFWHPGNPVAAFIIALLSMLAICIGFLISLDRRLNPKPDFGPFRDAIKVIDSKVIFYTSDKGPRVKTLAIATNQSAVSWQDIEWETHHFDNSGTLIDIVIGRSGMILGYGETALRMKSGLTRPETDYASHKVFIRAARNAQSWR